MLKTENTFLSTCVPVCNNICSSESIIHHSNLSHQNKNTNKTILIKKSQQHEKFGTDYNNNCVKLCLRFQTQTNSDGFDFSWIICNSN